MKGPPKSVETGTRCRSAGSGSGNGEVECDTVHTGPIAVGVEPYVGSMPGSLENMSTSLAFLRVIEKRNESGRNTGVADRLNGT